MIPIFPIHFKDIARQVLEQVEYAMQNQQVFYINYNNLSKYIFYLQNLLQQEYYGKTVLLQIHISASPVKVLNPYFEVVSSLFNTEELEGI